MQQAVSAVKSGQTIKVLKDLTISTTLKSQNSVKYTLDFNNHTVKGNKKLFKNTTDINKITGVIRFTRGNITIKNGKFSGYGTIKVEKGAQLTISSGSYWQLANAGKVSVSNSKFTNGAYPAILNQYTLTLNKVSTNCNKNHIVSKAGKVTINNGNFRNNDKKATTPMILLNKTDLVISGGTYTNPNAYVIQANSGTVKITSGSFRGNKKEVLYNGGGKYTITGGSFSSFYRTVLNQKGSMAISGGKFSCKATVCFENHGTASITGSTFDGKEGVSVSNYGILTINSGVFKSECLWASAVCCEEGDITIKNGTLPRLIIMHWTYLVQKNSSSPAENLPHIPNT